MPRPVSIKTVLVSAEAPGVYSDEVLQAIAPIGYKHINLRGILTFDLSQLGPSLLDRPAAAVRKHAAG
jgi:hypothetical protein